MWQNDTDGSRRRVWKSNWWEIINSFCRSITSLSPTGSPFWERRECGAKKFVERADSQSLTIWCTQHNWTNDNWRANSANSERQLENLAGNFVLFFSLSFSLSYALRWRTTTDSRLYSHFILFPSHFLLASSSSSPILPSTSFDSNFFVSCPSVAFTPWKKNRLKALTSWPLYTQIRPVPAVTIAASCLLRVCYSRTNERRAGERERKKKKNMSASGVRWSSTCRRLYVTSTTSSAPHIS